MLKQESIVVENVTMHQEADHKDPVLLARDLHQLQIYSYLMV